MPYFVYILQCTDGPRHTSDLARRMAQHNEGRGCQYTARRRPVILLFSQAHHSRDEARKRERQVKRWTRLKKLALARGDIDRVRDLARRRRR